MIEINFDGLIGPSHNYAGLSLGNVASAANAGAEARPRTAALQGLAKMRAAMALGLAQGFFVPPGRPLPAPLRAMGFAGDDDTVCAAAFAADPQLFAQAFSASSMWTANAATVSAAPDTADGRCHLSVANLSTMPHRSFEAGATERQLALAFANPHFRVHSPVVAAFGDEGAANHMRLCAGHGAPGVEVFVYGEAEGRFPARQNRRASEAVARRHGLARERTVFVRQSPAAIEAGAFHNDVVAVANERVLFAHEAAFADRESFLAELAAKFPQLVLVEVPESAVSLADAVGSYLFNSQLVSLPEGGMALILPTEAKQNQRVASHVAALVAGNGPIRRAEFVAVRESMRNGGGPACLRLRVAVPDTALVDPRFLLDEEKAERLARVIEAHWPERIAPADLGNPELWRQCRAARAALLETLDLGELS